MSDFTFSPEREPLTWDEIRIAVDSGQWQMFSRTAEVLDEYFKWREAALKSFVTVADELKIEVLGYISQVDANTGKLCAVRPSDPSHLRDKVLRLNSFPYATKPHGQIQHYVLWSLEELTEDQTEALLKERMPGHEFIHFVNPPHRKTIPEIHHYHVFCRSIDSGSAEN
ncbi:uncharacterized protein SPPG_01363 [Spizellomyces punctatus DAOM BR117]|uniref:Uncharacterized protein n=2 Tax=Spizellomyces punctatus (strain DAOM BR117) TaxID=645134 RepID=A0A0L0HS51_SPIPD|nr:uncharacterized protein SPPG_01363 [Spizellomyces punctatus DAOM BR117]KND03912.1 hypothetical protein SPPG_01363 [Spizellomyces punctatus DAOM BR117]|eukprot:XP_016611951.1 hypothetical protein SPPG_01363 [Spizellomyces punctatus DAOM BR117]